MKAGAWKCHRALAQGGSDTRGGMPAQIYGRTGRARNEPWGVQGRTPGATASPTVGTFALRHRHRHRRTRSVRMAGAPPVDGSSKEISSKEQRALRVCDVGCGRGYLTFATHAHLSAVGWDVDTYGVELRPAIVQEVEGIARRLGPSFDGLRFGEGAIASLLPMPRPPTQPGSGTAAEAADAVAGEAAGEAAAAEGPGAEGDEKDGGTGDAKDGAKDGATGGVEELDVLIALHACDTATDDALWCASAHSYAACRPWGPAGRMTG